VQLNSIFGNKMWSARNEQLEDGRALKFYVDLESSPISFSEILSRWQNDPGFRTFFTTLLADAPFSAFRWETPPITAATAHRPFEFVLLNSPGLATKPDADAFAEYFPRASGKESVVSFPNLGNDAILVVPCPRGRMSAYGHLAAFVREAPESQKHSLWELVGRVVEKKLGPTAVWLSTAGAGVSWLHVRLDNRPKYYGYGPYRSVAEPL
jgi:hypothetical protein